MSLPPEKASELKQLIHQQLSKVRSMGGPVLSPARGCRRGPEPGREGELRSSVRRQGSAEGSAAAVESGWETETVACDF